MSNNIYCGNNKLNKYLLNNTKILGTRYKCLKIGIQKGKSLPLDEDYLDLYEPIDNTKIYCGNSNSLNNNYDRFGNLPECLQKGIGIGKKIKADESQNDGGDEHKYLNIFNIKFLFFIIFEIILFLILFISKPNFIIQNSDKKIKNSYKKINVFNFLLVYISISIIIFFIFWYF